MTQRDVKSRLTTTYRERAMAQESTAADEPRKEVIGGSVSLAEKDLVRLAAERAGFRTVSEYVRDRMLRDAEQVMAGAA